MRKYLKITEHQQNMDPWDSDYRYAGFDRESGLHKFETPSGFLELFAKRKNPPGGWYLKRGAYTYEFCRDKRL